ncbi:MAG: nickel pincer cofactor-dependent isomerase, group 22 [Bacilli bacterium]
MEQLPRWVRVRQHFDGPVVADIEKSVHDELFKVGLQNRVQLGMRVAVTAGSRGIANMPMIMRSVVRELRRLGANPVIIPTMGSHGGATAEGQVEVLHSLGIKEEFCEAPILSSMDVVEIGRTDEGMPVYIDRHAHAADGIVLMGRVKLHTDFKSPNGVESGLMKMAAIGLGKHQQALLLHSHGIAGIRDKMPHVAQVTLKAANILCGLAIVENAYEQTAKIEAIETERIPEREPELLKEAANWMPKLPVEDLDLLIVDEIGKNYSGTGMDTNVIGRIRVLGVKEPVRPRIKYIFARGLSEASHGNALGIGLADITTQRLLQQINFDVMNENIITSSFLHRAMIPIALPDDRRAITAAMRGLWGISPEQARVMRIQNTLHLEDMYVSEALLPELRQLSNIELIASPEPMSFDAKDNLSEF